MMCCAIQQHVVEVQELPPFQPNDYLFKNHADKGTEKWEIFAWATRDVMAKVGGKGVHNISFKDRCAVYEYYMGRQDSLTFGNGVTVSYREDG